MCPKDWPTSRNYLVAIKNLVELEPKVTLKWPGKEVVSREVLKWFRDKYMQRKVGDLRFFATEKEGKYQDKMES